MPTVSTTQTVNLLTSMLGIDQNSNSNGVGSKVVQGSETTAPTSVNIADSFDIDSSELSHTLVLKDRLGGGAHLLLAVPGVPREAAGRDASEAAHGHQAHVRGAENWPEAPAQLDRVPRKQARRGNHYVRTCACYLNFADHLVN